jgi:hypothetical protein
LLKAFASVFKTLVAISMDGAVFGIPPTDPTERANHCRVGDTHMWRKVGEAASPDMAGQDLYGKQVPLKRAVALWGGVSPNGFSIVLFHATKKLDTETWVDAVNAGQLTNAIKSLKPVNKKGPWYVQCDNESFLEAKDSMKAYLRTKVLLWKIPAKSPDLNPVEKFWGWLRKKLRAADLKDLQVGRPPLGKMAYKARIRAICRGKKAQKVAANFANGLRKVCKEVKLKGGAAARG